MTLFAVALSLVVPTAVAVWLAYAWDVFTAKRGTESYWWSLWDAYGGARTVPTLAPVRSDRYGSGGFVSIFLARNTSSDFTRFLSTLYTTDAANGRVTDKEAKAA